MRQEEWNQEVEITDTDLLEITEQIKKGFTSGRLCDEEEKNIYWEIKIRSWKDE